jgi:PAS domain S-box-containing protein
MKELLITQINAQDPELTRQNLADAAESPGAVFRFRHKKKSGEVRDIEVFSSRIILGGRLLLHSIVQDITERVRAEEALRESREQYRELVENLSEAVISLDREGKFTYVSPVVERLYGFSPKDLIGKHFQEFLHPDDMHSFTDVFGKELAGTYPTDELRILARDGSVRSISVSPRPIERGGSVVGFNYVINDITERKKAEEEERLTRERFETLVKIAEMRDTGENRLSAYVLQAACRMTGSLFAFIGTVVPDESMMDITAWSPDVMGECRVSSAPLHFPVKTAGIWADAIREHRPKIVNDYAAACLLKKGLPDGHVRISRFLSVPILESGRVVMVAAVANKPAPYDDADVTRLTLLMQGIWGDLRKRKADEALRESEEKFRLFFNNVNDAVYVHRMDPDGRPGRLIEVNDVMCQRLGYTREELLSMSMGEILSDEGKRRMLRVAGEVERGGQATFETEHICKDGTILPVEVSTRRFMQGKIPLALANARDITERKKSEAILKKSEALLNEMGRLAQIGGWELDVRTQNLLLTSETYRISETPEEEPFDLTRALGYYDPPARASLEVAVQRCTEDGESFDLELPFTTAQGRHIWTRTVGHAVRRDEKTEKITGIFQDITARRQVEDALRESRSLLEAILNAITFRVFWKDKNLVFLGCNTAFARDAGYEKPEDVVGKDDYAMAWREQADIYRTDDRNVIGTGTEKLLFEEPQTNPAGEKICILTSKVPLRDAGGNAIGVLGTYLDITERKKAEAVLKDFNRELEEQVKAQTEKINTSLNEKVVLLREIHHRVKNNLQLIISLTNLQMRQSEDEQLIQIMKETQNRVRAMSLVHEKLYQSEDIARISLADYTRFLVTQLFAFYAVDSRQVKLEFDIDTIMLDINTAIPTGLIINELVSNALKHAFPENTAGTIFIAARDEGDTLSLSVRDTGTGMPRDFDWKESPTLGLRLVRILTEQLNGTIEILPVEKGTAFFIRLTRAKGSESAGK